MPDKNGLPPWNLELWPPNQQLNWVPLEPPEDFFFFFDLITLDLANVADRVVFLIPLAPQAKNLFCLSLYLSIYCRSPRGWQHVVKTAAHTFGTLTTHTVLFFHFGCAGSTLLRRFFSSCRERGYSLVVVCGLLTVIASLAAEGFSSCGSPGFGAQAQ